MSQEAPPPAPARAPAGTPVLRRLVIGIVAGVVAVGGALLLTTNLAPRPRPDATPIVVGRSPLLDQPAPAFDLPGLGGGNVQLSDFAGRPVVLTFFASWCGPCREEFPLLRATRDEHAEQGLAVLAIVHGDDPDAALRFAREHGADWPLAIDPGDTAWNAYRAPGMPTTYYIDRDGIVRGVGFGPPPPDTREELLGRILPDRTSSAPRR